MHIFISYAKSDTRELALRIRDALVAIPGVTAWMDESLQAASSWAGQIQAEIDRCDYMLVLLSPDVNRSATAERARSFVLNEIDYAQQEHKSIIPVMIQKTRVPLQIAGIQYIDFTAGDPDVGMRRLLLDIQRRAGLPVPATEARGLGYPSSPRRSDSKVVIGVVALVVLLVIAVSAAILSNRPNGLNGPTATPSETPNDATLDIQLKTQAVILATEIAKATRPDPTQKMALLLTDINATAIAAVPTATATTVPSLTPVPTEDTRATLVAAARQTADSSAATWLAETQSAQATADVPTNVPLPTDTPLPTTTFTPNPTLTPTFNMTQTAEAVNTQSAQQTAVLDVARATIAAESATEQDRIRRAAFNITLAFEGGGYATYQNFDSGIISYGRFQFSLATGSLGTIVERYVARSNSTVAAALSDYLPRISNKDEGLRSDPELKALLIEAASDPVMQAVQDEVAAETLWQPIVDLSISPRNIQSALGYALIFDTAINHGVRNSIIRSAEQALGVPEMSVVGQNGITEEQLIAKVAELRRDSLYALADRSNLPGLKIRGDFWVTLVTVGDWNLQGDADGNLNVKGRTVQVRNP